MTRSGDSDESAPGLGSSSFKADSGLPEFEWSEPVGFCCPCGRQFVAVRWYWVNIDASPARVEQLRQQGPIEGKCEKCGRNAIAGADYLEISPSRQRAELVLCPTRRAELSEALSQHLDRVRRYLAGDFVASRGNKNQRVSRHGLVGSTTSHGLDGRATVELPSWILQPRWRFVFPRAFETKEQAVEKGVRGSDLAPSDGVPSPIGRVTQATSKAVSSSLFQSTASEKRNTANVWIGRLRLRKQNEPTDASGASIPTVVVDLDIESESIAKHWGPAAIQAWPLHLNEYGYPLLGVRIRASYLGRSELMDAVVDVATRDAGEIFAQLARRFRFQLIWRNNPALGKDSSETRREVHASALNRNAALCFESARASLAANEFPVGAFDEALARLRRVELPQRMRSTETGLSPGAYQHLLSPRETWIALGELDRASNKKMLQRLLEVEGFPIREYEEIRKRVLLAAIQFGLCPPRKFWKRLVASGLVRSLEEQVQRLVQGRLKTLNTELDDLSEDQRETAWKKIEELCLRARVAVPVEMKAVWSGAISKETSEGNHPAKDQRARSSMNAAGEISMESMLPSSASKVRWEKQEKSGFSAGASGTIPPPRRNRN